MTKLKVMARFVTLQQKMASFALRVNFNKINLLIAYYIRYNTSTGKRSFPPFTKRTEQDTGLKMKVKALDFTVKKIENTKFIKFSDLAKDTQEEF